MTLTSKKILCIKCWKEINVKDISFWYGHSLRGEWVEKAYCRKCYEIEFPEAIAYHPLIISKIIL